MPHCGEVKPHNPLSGSLNPAMRQQCLEDLRSQKRAEALAAWRLIYPKPPLRSSTKADAPKNQNPRNGQHGARLTGGLVPFASESAPSPRLWIFPESATSRRIAFTVTGLQRGPIKIGHFYFAGNKTCLLCSDTTRSILPKAPEAGYNNVLPQLSGNTQT